MRTGLAGLVCALLTGLPATVVSQQVDQSRYALPATDPAGWITTDDYPPAAIRASLEGTVSVRMDVDAAGQLTACTVTQSSSSPVLDTAACDALRKRATFVPGKAGRMSVRTVTWKMPISDPNRPIDVARTKFPDTKFEIEVTIGVNGAIEQCRVIESASLEGDPCGQYPIGQSQGPGYVRNGKPVRAIKRLKISHSLTFAEVQ